MEYRLLCDGDGIILTREPELVHGELYISFKGAPDRATAIFERDDGESAYRALSDGVCAIESGWLGGSMKVTVAVLDGSMRAQRWRCERFRALVQKGGGVLIYPDDEDLRKRIVVGSLKKNSISSLKGTTLYSRRFRTWKSTGNYF